MTHEHEDIQLAKIQQVKEDKEEDILELPNVVGLGIGYKERKGKATNETCISVYVRKKVAAKSLESRQQVPKALDDVKTDVIEVGDIEAQAFTSRLRPAKPWIKCPAVSRTAMMSPARTRGPSPLRKLSARSFSSLPRTRSTSGMAA